jgi:hypothetical protein
VLSTSLNTATDLGESTGLCAFTAAAAAAGLRNAFAWLPDLLLLLLLLRLPAAIVWLLAANFVLSSNGCSTAALMWPAALILMGFARHDLLLPASLGDLGVGLTLLGISCGNKPSDRSSSSAAAAADSGKSSHAAAQPAP